MVVFPRPVMTVDDYLIAVITFWMGPLHNFKREERPGVDTLDDETGTTRLELPLCNSQEKWEDYDQNSRRTEAKDGWATITY